MVYYTHTPISYNSVRQKLFSPLDIWASDLLKLLDRRYFYFPVPVLSLNCFSQYVQYIICSCSSYRSQGQSVVQWSLKDRDLFCSYCFLACDTSGVIEGFFNFFPRIAPPCHFQVHVDVSKPYWSGSNSRQLSHLARALANLRPFFSPSLNDAVPILCINFYRISL